MSRIEEILDQLNAYQAPEPHECDASCGVPCRAPEDPTVWSDVIWQLPEFDIDVQNAASRFGYGAEFVLRDGTPIAYDGQLQKWVRLDPKTGVAIEQS